MHEIYRSPNVYGIETEYNCLIGFPITSDPSQDEYYELVGECHSVDGFAGDSLRSTANFSGSGSLTNQEINNELARIGLVRSDRYSLLSNGGRLYTDESGLEYCTPETRTAEEAVLRCFDGDTIMLSLLEGLRRSEVIRGYQVNRRIVDHNRQTRGIHLNNNADKSIVYDGRLVETTLLLATLNVAKGAIFGSGGLLINSEGETEYHHSPRLSVSSMLNSDGHAKKALVRDIGKDDGQYTRVETITADALNFAWPMRASMVLTNAFIGLLERDGDYNFPVLHTPEMQAQLVGRHGNNTLLDAYNRDNENLALTPAEQLSAICYDILESDSLYDFLDDEEKQVIPEIIDVIDRMVRDETSVATQVESIARKMALERKMEASGYGIDSEKICRYDYYWDMLQGGVAETLRNVKNVGWDGFTMPNSDTDKNHRIVTPPQDTRAKVRGDSILGKAEGYFIDWNSVRVGDELKAVHPLDSNYGLPPESQ